MEILTEESCPHCKKTFESAHELENLEPKINKGSIKEIKGEQQNTQQIQKEPEVKEVIKEVTKVPSNIPAYKCKDGNCGRVHPNKNYQSPP